MQTTSRSPRLKPIVIGLVAALVASTANAQQATPDKDAAFRANVPTAAVDTTGVPGGKVAKIITNTSTGSNTATPIQHVILIIGENRTFDHVFATYTPPKGQTVNNLLSEGIVTATGAPGPNVALAAQWQASDTSGYSNSPTHTKVYSALPSINTGYAPTAPYFSSLAEAEYVEPALPSTAYPFMVSGGTGLPYQVLDTRFPTTLANAPVSMHSAIGYDAYANSPVHRFFQMWQQMDCSASTATAKNPSGCRADLFPWVETTVGAGTNGSTQPAGFTNESTGEGATSMEFMNMAQGDAPYFKQLASTYALSDNFHQSVMGGTGANHIMLGFGTPIYYADANGHPAVPPSNQIENPNPQSGTNNWYAQDGYSGGSYVNCSANTQPGVAVIKAYLASLPHNRSTGGDCLTGAYYLVNNYNPGYLGDGTAAPLGSDQFTIPPSTQPNLATLLSNHGVSWKYYGEGWDNGAEDGEGGTYCNICDPFLYSTQVMTNPTLRANNQDINNLYTDITNGTLPAVSIVKPDGILDGHPSSSKLDLFEGYVQKITQMVQANPAEWANTAIMVTMDEGGGYYDSGYVQPVDFMGDGTRIPLLVISPYSTGGRVVHTYYDHVSFDKFVETNWMLGATISPRSRDNLPNPVASSGNLYAPANTPAIGNLMDMFDFGSSQPKD
jgi:phospholipase C